MKHELKILDTYFDAVDNGIKPFEVRKNDRNFQVGDMLYLKEITRTKPDDDMEKCATETYTGRTCEKYISYILYLDDFEFQPNNVVVLGLKE